MIATLSIDDFVHARLETQEDMVDLPHWKLLVTLINLVHQVKGVLGSCPPVHGLESIEESKVVHVQVW